MKILFLSAYYPPNTRGGAEVSTYLIAEGLKALGHQVDAVFEGKPVVLGLTKKPLWEKTWAKRVAGKLKQAVDLSKYDLVHAQDFRTALVLAELGLENSVVTIRDYWPISGTTNYLRIDGRVGSDSKWSEVWWQNPRVREARGLRKIARAWQYAHNLAYRKWAWEIISRKIYISKAQRNLIEDVLGVPGNSSVIYNPVSQDYLTDVVGGRSLGREVLYAGRVEFYKGVGLLLESWREVVKRVPGAHLTIIGEGAQRREYEDLVDKWGLGQQVSFQDRVKYGQLRDVYDRVAVVVAPHLWLEPFGRTVVEAQARGKIVVAANHGGPSEMIEDGRTGILFEKGSKESLARVLEKGLLLPEMKRREIQKAARSWAEDNLRVEKIAGEYVSLYKSWARV